MLSRRFDTILALAASMIGAASPSCQTSGAVTAATPAIGSPAGRWGHAMAYDSVVGAVLMFGGTTTDRAALADLWSWNGSEWRLLAQGGPEARDAAILVHDSRRGRTVLVGGRSQTGAVTRGTWEWDGSRWMLADTGGPARVHGAGSFDAAHGKVVIFGGITEQTSLAADTWTWDGRHWEQVDTVGLPGRIPNGMTYDPSRRAVVMLTHVPATAPGGVARNELLQWSGSRWTTVVGNHPAAGPIQALAAVGDNALAFVQGESPAMFTFEGGAWTMRGGSGLTPRSGHAVAFDSRRRRLVLFGGGALASRLADTWEWDGVVWRRVAGP